MNKQIKTLEDQKKKALIMQVEIMKSKESIEELKERPESAASSQTQGGGGKKGKNKKK